MFAVTAGGAGLFSASFRRPRSSCAIRRVSGRSRNLLHALTQYGVRPVRGGPSLNPDLTSKRVSGYVMKWNARERLHLLPRALNLLAEHRPSYAEHNATTPTTAASMTTATISISLFLPSRSFGVQMSIVTKRQRTHGYPSTDLRALAILSVGNRMVAAQLNKPLVQGVGDEVALVGSWLERSVDEGFKLERRTHAPQLEIAEPELAMRKQGISTKFVERVGRLTSHDALPSVRCRNHAGRDGWRPRPPLPLRSRVYWTTEMNDA